jgi:aminoglycoside 3-N-acetyltransferase
MANDSLIKKIFSCSPHIEMISRRLYWNNVKWLSKRVKKNKISEVNITAIDFNEIENFLLANGVDKGSLIVIHSAYAPFKGRGKTPNQILDMLFEIVGNSGTVAMPAMAKFKNAVDVEDYLSESKESIVYEYDVLKSKIKTGVLPLMLHKRKESVRSRHPINTMVAMGPLAEHLMGDNLEGISPLACGVNSSWNHCVEEDAVIIALGTDLTHSLTMIHVVEDVLDKEWPINNWYLEKEFSIKDGDFHKKVKLRERAPKWGALHFGERTLCKDLMDKGILKSTIIDGVTVEVLKAKDLIEFLNERNSTGYPYFWINR